MADSINISAGPLDTTSASALAQREYENEQLFKLCADEIEELRRQVKAQTERADTASAAAANLKSEQRVEEDARASEAETLRRLAKERADALSQAKLELGRVRAQYRTEKRRAKALRDGQHSSGQQPRPGRQPWDRGSGSALNRGGAFSAATGAGNRGSSLSSAVHSANASRSFSSLGPSGRRGPGGSNRHGQQARSQRGAQQQAPQTGTPLRRAKRLLAAPPPPTGTTPRVVPHSPGRGTPEHWNGNPLTPQDSAHGDPPFFGAPDRPSPDAEERHARARAAAAQRCRERKRREAQNKRAQARARYEEEQQRRCRHQALGSCRECLLTRSQRKPRVPRFERKPASAATPPPKGTRPGGKKKPAVPRFPDAVPVRVGSPEPPEPPPRKPRVPRFEPPTPPRRKKKKKKRRKKKAKKKAPGAKKKEEEEPEPADRNSAVPSPLPSPPPLPQQPQQPARAAPSPSSSLASSSVAVSPINASRGNAGSAAGAAGGTAGGGGGGARIDEATLREVAAEIERLRARRARLVELERAKQAAAAEDNSPGRASPLPEGATENKRYG